MQNALWELGGVPLQHRTDRLSTAVNNMSDEREFTARYEALMRHYRLEGQKIQAGKANENGDVEQRHHRLKRAVEQALMLRGSRDFGSAWRVQSSFCELLLAQLNAGRRQRLAEEMQYLRALPERRLESAKRERVKVDSGSLIYVDRNVYSVHSRLIGEQVEARLQAETDRGLVRRPESGRTAAACAAAASIASITGTSSTGWCASRGLRELPLPGGAVSHQPVPDGLGRAAGTGAAASQQAVSGDSGAGGQGRRSAGGRSACAVCWSRARSAKES